MGCTEIVFHLTSQFVVRTFGRLTVDQILWNIQNSVAGLDPNLVDRAIGTAVKAALGCALWVALIFFLVPVVTFFRALPRRIVNFCRALTLTKVAAVLPALLCLAAVYMVVHDIRKADDRIGLVSYLKNSFVASREDFFAAHYRVPALSEITFSTKKNLVIVLSESMEKTFGDPATGTESVIPNLSALAGQYQSAGRELMARGTEWTIAALTGWHFGIPLKLPSFVEGNSYHSKRGFLPGALSVFDILKANGYDLVMVRPADANFSGMRTLFTTHGGFEIKDRVYWESRGDLTEENRGTGWGFNDAYILRRAREEFDARVKAGKPFVLFVETLDTHAPDGWCRPDERRRNDIRDPIAHTDRLTAAFVRDILAKDTPNTVVSVLGDHYFMGNPDFIRKVPERRIFNLFAGDTPTIPLEKKRMITTAFDIAPTLLQAAGARWRNDQFGLGVSLFSRSHSLPGQIGFEAMNRGIEKQSARYKEFY